MALNIKVVGFLALLLQYTLWQNSALVFAQYAKIGRAEAEEKCNTAYNGVTCKDVTKYPEIFCKKKRKYILEGNDKQINIFHWLKRKKPFNIYIVFLRNPTLGFSINIPKSFLVIP